MSRAVASIIPGLPLNVRADSQGIEPAYRQEVLRSCGGDPFRYYGKTNTDNKTASGAAKYAERGASCHDQGVQPT